MFAMNGDRYSATLLTLLPAKPERQNVMLAHVRHQITIRKLGTVARQLKLDKIGGSDTKSGANVG